MDIFDELLKQYAVILESLDDYSIRLDSFGHDNIKVNDECNKYLEETNEALRDLLSQQDNESIIAYFQHPRVEFPNELLNFRSGPLYELTILSLKVRDLSVILSQNISILLLVQSATKDNHTSLILDTPTRKYMGDIKTDNEAGKFIKYLYNSRSRKISHSDLVADNVFGKGLSNEQVQESVKYASQSLRKCLSIDLEISNEYLFHRYRGINIKFHKYSLLFPTLNIQKSLP